MKNFISINESSLKFNNIENILSYDLIFNDLTYCEKCNLGENFSNMQNLYLYYLIYLHILN